MDFNRGCPRLPRESHSLDPGQLISRKPPRPWFGPGGLVGSVHSSPGQFIGRLLVATILPLAASFGRALIALAIGTVTRHALAIRAGRATAIAHFTRARFATTALGCRRGGGLVRQGLESVQANRSDGDHAKKFYK